MSNLFFPLTGSLFLLLLLSLTDDDALNLDKKKKKWNSPTVMIFKDGEKKDVVIGAVPKSTLVQTLEKYID